MENGIHSDNDQLSNKNQNNQIKQQQRKRRRKRLDQEGRDYTCVCGKSYLSYPALYTHVKTKHNGQPLYEQKKGVPINSICYGSPNINNSKQALILKGKLAIDDQDLSIERLKQYLYKQFIKQKQKQFIYQFKNSLKLKQEELLYINEILRPPETIQPIETKNQYSEMKPLNSNAKSESFVSQNKQDDNQIIQNIQNSPQLTNFQKVSLFKAILQKNHLQNKPFKIERKGFSSYVPPTIKQKTEQLPIDQVFGRFLNEVFHINSHSDIVNLVFTYFLCRIREFYLKKYQEGSMSQRSVGSLIEQSNQIVGFLIQIQNPYLRQPIVVCKILFSFYRWMFKNKLTTKFVRFNEAGNNIN